MTRSSTTIGGKTYNKGDSFTDSAGRTGKVGFDSKTGKALSNPVVGSSGVYAQNNALDRELKGLTGAYRESNNILSAERARIAEERSATLGDIKIQSDIDLASQKVGQERDYGARATSLITSGGGFLGATQSQEGVLQNLKGTFDAEKTALTSKRDAAINAANAAYGDRDFALAKELANNAKSLQNDIYKRQTDSADQELKIAAGNRAQTSFDVEMADKKISAYSIMSDKEFESQNPDDIAKIDANYYDGYTNNARILAKKAQEIKTRQEEVDLDKDVLSMRLQMPWGKKFVLGGVTYAGLKIKEAGQMSLGDQKISAIQKVGSWFTSKTTIPGTDSIPFIDSTGFATPQGWQTAFQYSGLDRTDYIKQFGYLLHRDVDSSGENPYTKYGLTGAEGKLLTGVTPVE